MNKRRTWSFFCASISQWISFFFDLNSYGFFSVMKTNSAFSKSMLVIDIYSKWDVFKKKANTQLQLRNCTPSNDNSWIQERRLKIFVTTKNTRVVWWSEEISCTENSICIHAKKNACIKCDSEQIQLAKENIPMKRAKSNISCTQLQHTMSQIIRAAFFHLLSGPTIIAIIDREKKKAITYLLLWLCCHSICVVNVACAS